MLLQTIEISLGTKPVRAMVASTILWWWYFEWCAKVICYMQLVALRVSAHRSEMFAVRTICPAKNACCAVIPLLIVTGLPSCLHGSGERFVFHNVYAAFVSVCDYRSKCCLKMVKDFVSHQNMTFATVSDPASAWIQCFIASTLSSSLGQEQQPCPKLVCLESVQLPPSENYIMCEIRLSKYFCFVSVKLKAYCIEYTESR